jgi:hypothetical protein
MPALEAILYMVAESNKKGLDGNVLLVEYAKIWLDDVS